MPIKLQILHPLPIPGRASSGILDIRLDHFKILYNIQSLPDPPVNEFKFESQIDQ